MSQIAMANAFFRARESARPPGEQILVDPLAERLVRTIWSLQLLWWGRGLVPGMSLLLEQLQTVHCVRHAAVDALVSRALDAGCTQVVTLGAGLDARPARLPGAGRARWFEVDQSPFIGHKAALIAEAGVQVTHVKADLSRPDWSVALERAGLDRAQQTVWVAEGLIHDLPPLALRWWLTDAVALSAQPWLVLSTIRPEVAAAADGRLRRLLRFIAEIPAVYFTAEDLRSAARLAGGLRSTPGAGRRPSLGPCPGGVGGGGSPPPTPMVERPSAPRHAQHRSIRQAQLEGRRRSVEVDRRLLPGGEAQAERGHLDRRTLLVGQVGAGAVPAQHEAHAAAAVGRREGGRRAVVGREPHLFGRLVGDIAQLVALEGSDAVVGPGAVGACEGGQRGQHAAQLCEHGV